MQRVLRPGTVLLVASAIVVLIAVSMHEGGDVADLPNTQPIGEPRTPPVLLGASALAKDVQAVSVPVEGLVRVLDLVDGNAAEGARLTCERDGVRFEVTVDENGHLLRHGQRVTGTMRLLRGMDGWQLASRLQTSSASDRVLWVWRYVDVRGVALSADPDRPASPVEVNVLFGGGRGEAGDPGRAPWTLAWLRRAGVPTHVRAGMPSSDGAFRLQMPRIQGFGVRARAVGFEAAWTLPTLGSTTETVDVRLQLEPGVRVEGVVRDDDGMPLAGVEVRAYVVQHLSLNEQSFADVKLALGDAYTANWLPDEDRAVTTSAQAVRTNARGEFSMVLRRRGQTALVCYAKGRKPEERELGAISQDTRAIDISMERATSKTQLTITNRGTPLREGSVIIADPTLPEVQAAFIAGLDEAGQMSTQWLIHGRTYFLCDRTTPYAKADDNCGYFTWHGQETLDTALLASDP